ncbi:hypothetical protein Dimus_014599 [Dionaea muscipula]
MSSLVASYGSGVPSGHFTVKEAYAHLLGSCVVAPWWKPALSASVPPHRCESSLVLPRSRDPPLRIGMVSGSGSRGLAEGAQGRQSKARASEPLLVYEKWENLFKKRLLVHVDAVKEFYAKMTRIHLKKKDVVKSSAKGISIELDHERPVAILDVPRRTGIREYIKEDHESLYEIGSLWFSSILECP